MKPLHLKAAAALAVAALAGVGYQTAFAGEPAPGGSAAEGAPASSAKAAAAMDVDYYSESLSAELTDIAALSKSEGWAIGTSSEDGAGGDPEQVLLHRDGGEWKPSELPKEAAGASLSQIEGSAPDNVWLFATENDQSGSLAFRFDGEKWTAMPAPDAEGSPSNRGAAVLAADDAWVLGHDKSVHHWDGTKWTESQLPAVGLSLAGVSPDDVWAVGFRETSDDSGPLSQPAAMHWDGEEWKLEKTPEYHFPDPAPPEESASLDSAVAVSGDEVWAVGTHTFNHGEGGPEPEEEPILLRWDGKEWKEGPADAAEKASEEFAPDGAGGLVLGRYWHMAADGELREIARHKPVPGRSGKVEEVDKKQRFWPDETVHVPGTKQVWSTGVIELGAYGDANFRRGAILSYDAG